MIYNIIAKLSTDHRGAWAYCATSHKHLLNSGKYFQIGYVGLKSGMVWLSLHNADVIIQIEESGEDFKNQCRLNLLETYKMFFNI